MLNHREYRRFLPHFQNEHRTYFVTFCTRDRWVLPEVARDIVLAEVRSVGGSFLHTCVVMPDHVHVLLTPYSKDGGVAPAICEIVRMTKGRSARIINSRLHRSGPVWQREFFDREVRNSEDIRAKGEYIAQNPVRAGLVSRAGDYAWLWREWIDQSTSTG